MYYTIHDYLIDSEKYYANVTIPNCPVMTWRWRSAIPFARSQATGCWGPWWLLYGGEIWWLWGTRWPWITPLCTTQGSPQSKPIRQMRWWPTAQTGKTLWVPNAAEGTKSQLVFAVWTKHGFHTLLLPQKKYVIPANPWDFLFWAEPWPFRNSQGRRCQEHLHGIGPGMIWNS